ncbi:MAG: DUF3996 domain-containing protein [Treponema sp.]|nr:DUF3996 domain-containing protein [Treponema sp.]
MKKLALCIVLATVLTAGTAFASPVHSGGLGIGGLWGGGVNMAGPGDNFNNYWALSLKVPANPLFWGLSLRITSDYMVIGAQGDYYFLGAEIVPTFYWFLGVGGFASVWTGSGNNGGVSFGARLPVGVSWQPIDIFELFFNIAPSLGVMVRNNRFEFPHSSFNFEVGFRFWLD